MGKALLEASRVWPLSKSSEELMLGDRMREECLWGKEYCVGVLGNRRKVSVVTQEMTDPRLQAEPGDRQGWRDQQRSDHVGFSRL